jgi:hypothetical protein
MVYTLILIVYQRIVKIYKSILLRFGDGSATKLMVHRKFDDLVTNAEFR